ncbi:MAG: ATP-binding cassette domain-containing protein [Aminobacteriaceae bacterium]
MLLPAFPFVAVMATISTVALCVLPRSRSSVKGVVLFIAPLGFGFWLIHGGVFASLIGGVVQQNRGLWALGLWLRILSVVASSRILLSSFPPPLMIRWFLASKLPTSFAFLLASPLLLVEQIKARIAQIQEAQLARGVPVHGTFRERASSLTALLFPLVLGLLNDLPARSTALDMKAFGLSRRRSSLFGEGMEAHGLSASGDAQSEAAKNAEKAESYDLSSSPDFVSVHEYGLHPEKAGSPGIPPLLALDGTGFSAPGTDALLVSIPELRLLPGEWMLLEGGNGSGKSTMAMILCGGVPEHRSGKLSGGIELFARPVTSRTCLEWSQEVQLVQQNPQLSFSGCAFTVCEEIAFGPENLALPLKEIRLRVDEALELLDIVHLKENDIATLSGGEAQKVALASAAAMHPGLLLLDEAFGRIASPDVPVLLERLRAWSKSTGAAVLLLERRRQVFEGFCDHVGYLHDGIVSLEAGEKSASGRSLPEAIASVFRGGRSTVRFPAALALKEESTLPCEDSPALLRIQNVDFRWKEESKPLLRSLNAALEAGERAALIGPNGAGKSTLMRLCAGLLTPERGDVLLGGTSLSEMHPKERAARIGFLFQDAERQIFHPTVAEEVLFSLRDEALSPDERMERLETALRATGLRGKEKKHPMDLNAAERRMVAVASIAVRGAELLLLDEPSRDFDPQWQELFEEWLYKQRAAVLAISHDPGFVERLFPQVWELNEGELARHCNQSLSRSCSISMIM